MKEKLIKLINVKTIVTFVACGLWIYLTLTDKVEASDFFKTTFTMILGVYFGSNIQKHSDAN